MSNQTGNQVVIERDVTFAQVDCDGKNRLLKMDIYRPEIQPVEDLPAVILAFGGAFHRGSRQDDTVFENGQGNTPIAEYCRRLAMNGFVAFSVDYRLAQEKPTSGYTPVLGRLEVPLDRINIVRNMLGLPPISSDDMREVQESAIDDMASAFRYVAGASRRLGVDPQKIVVGGFSAGGRNAITAAFGEDIDPAGVICMSSYIPDFVVERYAENHLYRFPILAISAENDLGYIREEMPKQHALLSSKGFEIDWRVVPGYGHFYPAEAETQNGINGTETATVLGEILQFLADIFRDEDGDSSGSQAAVGMPQDGPKKVTTGIN